MNTMEGRAEAACADGPAPCREHAPSPSAATIRTAATPPERKRIPASLGQKVYPKPRLLKRLPSFGACAASNLRLAQPQLKAQPASCLAKEKKEKASASKCEIGCVVVCLGVVVWLGLRGNGGSGYFEEWGPGQRHDCEIR